MDLLKEAIEPIAKKAISERAFPGAVIGIVRKNGERAIFPFGKTRYEQDALSMETDSVFDVASVTKSIPTGSLALRLIEEGRLKTSDRLIDFVPEFRNNFWESVLTEHLLTYSLDAYSISKALKHLDAEGLANHIFTTDFIHPPGSVFKCSNIPAFLMGLVIERISGKPLEVFARETFFEPLGMSSTTFHPETLDPTRVVPTEVDDEHGVKHAKVHDESAYAFKREGRIVGHAGLFSTAPDLLSFLEMLLRGGEKDAKRYFREETVRLMHTNQIRHLNDCNGLGWELFQPRYMGNKARETTFWKTGFTGTLVICDPDREIAFAILANRVHPKRPPDSNAINAFRAAVSGAIFTYAESL